MFFSTGLDAWEIIARSALCVGAVMSVATTIGVTVAYLATREPRAAAQPAVAPVARSQPAPEPARPQPAPVVASAH